jgi:hypothetical protein
MTSAKWGSLDTHSAAWGECVSGGPSPLHVIDLCKESGRVGSAIWVFMVLYRMNESGGFHHRCISQFALCARRLGCFGSIMRSLTDHSAVRV